MNLVIIDWSVSVDKMATDKPPRIECLSDWSVLVDKMATPFFDPDSKHAVPFFSNLQVFRAHFTALLSA